jgi:hypothetical protein
MAQFCSLTPSQCRNKREFKSLNIRDGIKNLHYQKKYGFHFQLYRKRWKRLKLEKCWNKNKTCHEEIMKTELMD